MCDSSFEKTVKRRDQKRKEEAQYVEAAKVNKQEEDALPTTTWRAT